jgi:hypothetical protein
MDNEKLPFIDIGYQLFIDSMAEEVGAIRDVAPEGRPELLIYVENAGEFRVPLTAVKSVLEEKVVLAADRLPAELRQSIERAHQAEQPGL